MSGIFVSYRREERGAAIFLCGSLFKAFDPEKIFVGFDATALGESFVKVIETTVTRCDLLIAVIGNNWLSSKDEQGGRRLDNPEDSVRLEIVAALEHNIPVIPVLVDGASMPRSADLPDDLKPLVRRHALRISTGHSSGSGAVASGGAEKDTSFDANLAASILQVLDKEPLAELKDCLLRLDRLIPVPELLDALSSGRFPRIAQRRDSLGRDKNPVDCTVFAPDHVEPKQSGLLQVFLHTPEDRERAEALASKYDSKTKERGHKSLVLDAPVGTRFTFDVEIEGFVFKEQSDTIIWTGKPQSAAFPFIVPPHSEWGSYAGSVGIWSNGVPTGRIRFQIWVVPNSVGAFSRPLGEEARHYHTCFCSYSSLDRIEMLKRAQGLQATGLETFIDVMDLRPGDKWNPKIFAAINRSDLFVVIWSSNAKNSKWVRRESRYAIRRYESNGSPDFRPIPVEGPPIPAVPRGMKAFHFNDQLLSLLRAAEIEAK